MSESMTTAKKRILNKELKLKLVQNLENELRQMQRALGQAKHELHNAQSVQKERKARVAAIQQLIWELKR